MSVKTIKTINKIKKYLNICTRALEIYRFLLKDIKDTYFLFNVKCYKNCKKCIFSFCINCKGYKNACVSIFV